MYHIDWEGAYDAWKKSGLSQQKFQYSQHFKCFIGQEGVPSAETIRICAILLKPYLVNAPDKILPHVDSG